MGTLEDEARRAGESLQKSGCTLVTAESCTAGALARLLADQEGATSFFHGSYVTYTKAHKQAALAVPQAVLDQHTAVSEPTVRYMAKGALQKSTADFSLAITGVTGPQPDEDGNPVGLVYVSLAARGAQPIVERHEFLGDPAQVRTQAQLSALRLLQKCLAPQPKAPPQPAKASDPPPGSSGEARN